MALLSHTDYIMPQLLQYTSQSTYQALVPDTTYLLVGREEPWEPDWCGEWGRAGSPQWLPLHQHLPFLGDVGRVAHCQDLQ